MIKVTLQKQNDREIEFIKEIELQVLPPLKKVITVDGKEYVVKSIDQIDSKVIMTVRDKGFRKSAFWN